ncbi:MAG: radical SAM protein [Desulfobacterales bacterium]|jgi:MoaA/NifB/PqqE/SkfB family radical SAM enzyme
MTEPLNHLEYYRLPWNYADNGISWLEPTTDCNLRCEGCYRDPRGPGHKTLQEVRADLEVFKKLRKSDCMSIAGGDPLVYPQIVDLVKMIKDMGWKPIINTNGLALDESLLKDLKKAGVFGFTFHIDTSQKRPKVTAETEAELNDLRLHYAQMLAKVGGIACSFNATISEKTIYEIPEMVSWSQQHADIVHTMVFILFRSPEITGDFDFFADGEKIALSETYKDSEWGGSHTLMAADAVAKIRQADPQYEPCAYLNGTANPSSLKWLLANRVIFNGDVLGYFSPKIMEIIQTFTHLFSGTYLAYAEPRSTAKGKLSAFLGGLIDRKMRSVLFKLLRQMISKPRTIMQPAYIQSFMIIQPVNFESDGRQDMCDSCPDITVHDGKLVWSCRLEELNQYGAFVQTVPKRETNPS